MEPQQTNPTPEPATIPEISNSKKPSLLLVYLLFILIFLGLASWVGVYLNKDRTESVAVTNEMDTWKTYRNEDYGFEFKYPDNFNNFNVLDTSVGGSKILHFCFSTNSSNYPSGRCGSDGKAELFLILSMPKNEWDSNQEGGTGILNYLGERDGVVFGYDRSQDAPKDLKLVYSKVGSFLSTFKFINENDISTWKTYRNDEYGFEFKYPEEAVIPGTPVMSGNTIILEIGMSNGIFILPKGESDYGYDEQPIISDVEIGGLKAKKQFWESDQRLEYKIIDPAKNWIPCGKDLKNCNRISIQWETKEQLEFLNQILSTFKFFDKTDISTWKTYENKELGFEFKYPNDWVKLDNYQSDPDLITVVSSQEAVDRASRCYEGCGPDLWFYRLENTNVDEYINDQGNLIYNPKKITINGNVAYEADEAGFSSYFIIMIQRGNDMYKIFGYNNELSLSSDTVESKILRTFKFIDKNDISIWKTYRNEEYGFEFKYPSDWVEVKWGLLTIDKEYVPNPQRQPHNFTGFCKIVFHDAFSEDSTIQDLIDNNYLSQKPSTTAEMLDNKKGTAFSFTGGSYKFFPLNSEKVLSVSIYCGEDVRSKGESVLNQILSTFKFTK